MIICICTHMLTRERERERGPRVGGCQPAQPTSHTADTLTTDNTTTTFITQDPGNNERQE